MHWEGNVQLRSLNISYYFIDLVAKVGLTLCMHYIVEYLQDECSFVSLRDVERVLQVMSWFYRQSEDDELLFKEIKEEWEYSDTESEEESMEAEFPQQVHT